MQRRGFRIKMEKQKMKMVDYVLDGKVIKHGGAYQISNTTITPCLSSRIAAVRCNYIEDKTGQRYSRVYNWYFEIY